MKMRSESSRKNLVTNLKEKLMNSTTRNIRTKSCSLNIFNRRDREAQWKSFNKKRRTSNQPVHYFLLKKTRNYWWPRKVILKDSRDATSTKLWLLKSLFRRIWNWNLSLRRILLLLTKSRYICKLILKWFRRIMVRSIT